MENVALYGEMLQQFGKGQKFYPEIQVEFILPNSYLKNSKVKPRLRWSDQLQQRFIQSLDALGGGKRATPKKILIMMNANGLTLRHLKSHLQKYRIAEKKEKCSGKAESSKICKRNRNKSLEIQDVEMVKEGTSKSEDNLVNPTIETGSSFSSMFGNSISVGSHFSSAYGNMNLMEPSLRFPSVNPNPTEPGSSLFSPMVANPIEPDHVGSSSRFSSMVPNPTMVTDFFFSNNISSTIGNSMDAGSSSPVFGNSMNVGKNFPNLNEDGFIIGDFDMDLDDFFDEIP